MNIDYIFIITLPHRADRLQKITSQLTQLGYQYEVFYGVNGKEIKKQYGCDNLNNGCTAAHGQIMQRAFIMGLENVLIVEDDCIFALHFIYFATRKVTTVRKCPVHSNSAYGLTFSRERNL